MPKAIMLMSGGVDSSVAAYLLKKEGYEIIGIHFKTVEDIIFSLIPEKKKVCCSPSDTNDALKVSNDIGLDDFKVISIKEEFKEKIIKYFIEEYSKGKTPNPCMLCNRYFKFGKAFDIMKELNADIVVSGHYVISEFSEKHNTYVIKKGIDEYKDQSYFLSMVKKEYLDKMYFPLGKLKKEEIRKIALNLGLTVAKKPDSQELCFIPDNNYVRYLKDAGLKIKEGNVLNLNGEVIGTHSGYTNYTIGQRTGIKYFKNASSKLYVYKLNSEKNEVTVAPKEKLYFTQMIVNKLNMFVEIEDKNVLCKIRKRNEEKKVKVIKINKNELKVIFEEPVFAITPGQFATFYDEDGIVLGSGIIQKYLED
ncbi:tRNA-specific 2-thiouridylase MnmA [Tepiditoga spiralis]|uniref:tRNA-specific 2-thiouridylase MnmA n=1 Tax=Tepiditoga spiralis TaxID=2108365 RepID=A0A7G1G6L9_9BACT|nr:tRNA 2-thiouridine(34) synthase MnmA [Tepiditoga spiralis]BBE31825.1 tRNA-specific 2-thiouridylase MnmA [Tepiditoga spiralis]